MDILMIFVGVVLGAVATWLVLRARSTTLRVELQTKLEAAQEKLEEYKRYQEESQKGISQTFGSLASEALKSNNEVFLQLANQAFAAQIAQGRGDLDLRRQAVEELVKPLSDSLRYIEKDRREAYGSLREQIGNMTRGQGQLERETRNLVQALRAPQVRGRWGEMTLRRVAELAGMVERCDFFEQPVLGGEGRGKRPDMVVHLPNERRIAVDAKTPLDGYLQSIEADTEEERASALGRHARQLRERIRELSGKSYWASLGYTPEFVVLFLPGEFFLGPALKEEPSLLEDAMKERVVLATPSTLISLLHAVAYGWREEQLAEHTRRISELGREVHDRVATWAGYLDKLRVSLERCVDAYNDSVGSLERRVLVSARRIKELGIATDKEIPELPPIESKTRMLAGMERDSVDSDSTDSQQSA